MSLYFLYLKTKRNLKRKQRLKVNTNVSFLLGLALIRVLSARRANCDIYYKVSAVADLRGASPPRVQILSISCSFGENLAKSYVAAPLGELASPPRGNPGSATDRARERIDWKQFYLNAPNWICVKVTIIKPVHIQCRIQDFSEGVHQTRMRCANLLFSERFCRKLLENERNLTKQWVRTYHPLGSANDIGDAMWKVPPFSLDNIELNCSRQSWTWHTEINKSAILGLFNSF